MSELIETYRGTVKAWECDHVEHFTVAYYFKSIAAAQLRLFSEIGVSPETAIGLTPSTGYVRFQREFRKADGYIIRSGVIAASPDDVTIGHQMINCEDDGISTVIELTVERPDGVDFEARVVDWETPERRALADIEIRDDWPRTVADVVDPSKLYLDGRLSLEGYVHLLSDASVQSQTLVGMTPKYMRDNRIGYSTMEFRFDFLKPPPGPGTLVEVSSMLRQYGRTSLGVTHVISQTHPNHSQTSQCSAQTAIHP
ncbi:MAG: thioesterase family protein, partial [Gammaproteobacteria bacterium]|nr:thioesterase family protein [Gammaproteobacteria bacterium]